MTKEEMKAEYLKIVFTPPTPGQPDDSTEKFRKLKLQDPKMFTEIFWEVAEASGYAKRHGLKKPKGL